MSASLAKISIINLCALSFIGACNSKEVACECTDPAPLEHDLVSENEKILSCYPEIDKSTMIRTQSRHPARFNKSSSIIGEGTQFLCGDFIFTIKSFDYEYADENLGGSFPTTKTLKEIGCKIIDNKIICREERVWNARGANLLSYREITASFVNTKTQEVGK
jgi:hypothetical protein